MSEDRGSIFVGGAGPDQRTPERLLLRLANRHGLVAGATGTGKTVTLQILAEGFSRAGVPVFLADAKGDLSGLAEPGSPAHPLHEKLMARAERIGLGRYAYEGFPVVFWDLFGAAGHPIRTTVTEMGPLLLARMLELNETQEGVLAIAFRVAEDEGLALLDLKDLRAMLVHVGENAAEIGRRYGSVAQASVGSIQRRLLVLESQGAEAFFGEPALELADMIATAPDGRGQINILAADRLMAAPRLYASFLLWLLSELFETLPEVGDPEKPRFVFFFDEAHLLFTDAPKVLIEKVERVARLIRSKGVGVYFVTQSPDDVPDAVLGQLGNRIQHALRAFTPRDAKALRLAAETFRANPEFDTETAIREVGTGEAVVSLLDAKGAPGIVQRTLIRPPVAKLGPCEPAVRAQTMAASPVAGRYERMLDRTSAYELLAERAERRAAEADAGAGDSLSDDGFGVPRVGRGRRYDPAAERDAPAPRAEPGRATPARGGRRSDSLGEAVAKQVARTATSQLTRVVLNGLIRGLFR